MLPLAVNQLNIQNAFYAAQLQHDVVRDVVANGNRHDVGVGFGGAANLHAVDVDACAAEDGCHLADHIGLIDVRCEQQVAFRIEVNMILVNLHNLRLLAVEQRALDFVRAFGGSNLDVDCRGEVASLISFDLFDLQITLFGNAGGVDIVDAVLQNRVQ